MEIQKTSNSQSNLEKEKWNWRNQPAWLQAIIQSNSHEDSMVLPQRKKHRSMEQRGICPVTAVKKIKRGTGDSPSTQRMADRIFPVQAFLK